VFDLIIGIDGAQRRTKRSFDDGPRQPRRRGVTRVRAAAASRLRGLADRIEPVGPVLTPAARATRA
jgi:hypothetical protein